MEAFKAYERDSKTKAYSKEGLIRQRERELKGDEGRRDITEWLQDRIEELKRQIEVIEGEMENEANKKKKTSTDTMTNRLERHNFHLDSLEKLLRMWENEAVEREAIEGIKDSVDYYVDNNQDDDFMEDDSIYEELGLDDWDPDALDHDYGDYEPESDEHSDLGTDDLDYSDGESNPTPATPQVMEPKPKPVEKVEKPAPAPAEPVSAPVKQATAPAPAAKKTEPVAPATSAPSLDPTPAEAARGVRAPAQEPQVIVASQPAATATSVAPAPVVTQPPVTANVAPALQPTVASNTIAAPATAVQQPIGPPPAATAPVQPVHSLTASLGFSDFSSAVQPQSQQSLVSSASIPQSTSSSASSTGPFASATIGIPRTVPPAPRAESELAEMAGLKASARYLPEPESTRTPYKPRTPSSTPSYYPSTPAQNLLDDPNTFQKFPPDLLFFLFYFQQNSYQQYLAARELKRQSWRYHTKYLTWFQRHEDPKTITPEYEQGTYVYFDYETGWCQRKKSEFTFQYVFLEDNDLP